MDGSDFAARRRAAIAKKEEARRALGLTRERTPVPTNLNASAEAQRRQSRKRPRKDVAAIPTRRSGRIAGHPTMSLREEDIESSGDRETKKQRKRDDSESEDTTPAWAEPIVVDNPADILSEAAERKDDLPEQSCKRLPTQLPVLNDEYLGEQIPFELGGPGRQAKRAAMQLACGDRRIGRVRFSRMSGIQEWSDAVLLFVNVGGAEYANMFLEGGRRMVWFGQRTQHEGSPVILRLVHHERGPPGSDRAHTPTGDTDHFVRVGLFCRLPDEPYIYCGQLRYRSHEPGTRPLRFEWELVHYERLKEQENFKRLLDA